jgi:hypothetical protein
MKAKPTKKAIPHQPPTVMTSATTIAQPISFSKTVIIAALPVCTSVRWKVEQNHTSQASSGANAVPGPAKRQSFSAESMADFIFL